MHKHFDKHKVLTNRNHGFRKGYSCETQLTITVDELCRNLDRGLQTDVAILDFSKAFDKVPHDLLLHKLDCFGIRGHLHTWIKSFLTNRQMRVISENEASAETTVHSGVPQGTVLGALLFLCHPRGRLLIVPHHPLPPRSPSTARRPPSARSLGIGLGYGIQCSQVLHTVDQQ